VPLARIGLGANLGDPRATLERAILALGGLGTVTARSSFYRSAPWGVTDQPTFVNAAVLLETALSPHELLRGLKRLEAELGRTETYRWGPRVVDLDILDFAGRTLNEPDLILPHARLFERAFALVPLAEIDPSYREALERLPATARAEVEVLAETPGRIGLVAARTAQPVDWDQTIARVRSAAAFCVEAGLERFRIEEDALTIEVSRRSSPAAPAPAELVLDAFPHETPPSNGAAHHPALPGQVLKAEFVGIVRFSRPALAEGAAVEAGRELAYVEALGIRNPVRTIGPGKLAAVYVADGQAVEYGQALFAVEDAL
jgi:2-amino-4-hydroxy-6-hydroxymethyldihydropteridine diphosphokinase